MQQGQSKSSVSTNLQSAPEVLDLSVLEHVGGGGPNGGWLATTGPNGGWSTNAGPNGGWATNAGPNGGWAASLAGPNGGW